MFDDDDVVVPTSAETGLSATAEPGMAAAEAEAEEVSVPRAAEDADSVSSTSGAPGPVRVAPHRTSMCDCGCLAWLCLSVTRSEGACESAAAEPLPAARQRP